MFKNCIILFVAIFSYNQIFAQSNSNNIAPFKIRLTNGEGYTYSHLKKNQPVILIYFETTCDHCKTFTEAFLKQISKLQESQVVMISYEHIKQVKAFDNAYKLSNQKNIKIGSEGYTYVVQKYYNIQHFPFVATYDKSGKLKKVIPWNSKSEEMVKQLL